MACADGVMSDLRGGIGHFRRAVPKGPKVARAVHSHRDPETHRRDLDRDRRLLAAGWSRRGYVAADVLGRPERILRDADLALGRPHRVDRLDPWLRLVGASLFDASGPARLAERLRGPERRKVADRDTGQCRSGDGIGHS